MLCLHLEAARNRRLGHQGGKARASKETDKIKNNLAARGPLAAFQAGLRSQGRGFGKTGMDSIFRSQRHQLPGKWEVSLSSTECSVGVALETPSPPQGLSLLGPPHGTTSLGCKCFFVLLFFLWDVGATEIFIKHSFFFGVAGFNSSLYILYI